MEVQDLIKNETPQKVIQILTYQSKNIEIINNHIKEFYKNDRRIRRQQVKNVQKDKIINPNTEKQKLVESVKITIPFQKKIVSTSVAFELGEPVTLVPNTKKENNKLVEVVKANWRNLRIDDKLQKLLTIKKSQTQGAILFYISELKESSSFTKSLIWLGLKSQKKEIKCSILDNRNGLMCPFFSDMGDMKAFVWAFKTKQENGKVIENTWIYDENNVYKIDNSSGEQRITSTEKHGFDRIPIVYVSQEKTEWEDVKSLIDRVEVAVSKLGGSNDYSGHPMLKIFGEVLNAPDKDEDGKAWIIPKRVDEDGKEIMGDVQLLTNPNSSESNKLEMDKLEDLIWSISQTPNLSFNNVKGIGNVSGVSLKLMFLDSMMKAKLNEGDNRTMIERIINIIISGITTTTNTYLASDTNDLYYDIVFNSILPDDLKESVEVVSQAVNSNVMSRKTAVEYLNMNPDTEEELSLIDEDENNNN